MIARRPSSTSWRVFPTTGAYRYPRQLKLVRRRLLLLGHHARLRLHRLHARVRSKLSFWGATVAANLIEALTASFGHPVALLMARRAGGDRRDAHTVSSSSTSASCRPIMFELLAAHRRRSSGCTASPSSSSPGEQVRREDA
jgi:hypothetical protein